MLSVANRFYVALASVLVLWFGFTYPAILSATEIWYGNEIYNHCFFVIPVSLFLIWEKRALIDIRLAQPSHLALIPISGALFLYLLGTAGEIQLFQHTATFSLLSFLFWFVLGNKLAYRLLFPLYFMIFSIPVGEELVPILQEITADISVWMLQLTGIPLFRSGLFIDIPEGRFLVAEACSGVSFLIASIVIGNLFAYMNFVTTWRKVLFILLSVIIPIGANAIRVYGIIFIGHKTDMEHAVGVDHLIYGWFFFAFVIVCLLLTGEWMRRREKCVIQAPVIGDSVMAKNRDQRVNFTHESKIDTKRNIIPFTLLIGLLFLAFVQKNQLSSVSPVNAEPIHFSLPFTKTSQQISSVAWAPIYSESAYQHLQSYQLQGADVVTIFYAEYRPNEGELVSSSNRLFDPEKWSLVSSEHVQLDTIPVSQQTISSSIGERIVVYTAYRVGGKLFASRTYAKLYEMWLKFTWHNTNTSIIAVAMTSANEIIATNVFATAFSN